MRYEAVMFDLDGTLADTLADIAAAGNHMLRSFGRPPLPVDRYCYLAGQGIAYLVRHALETDDASLIEDGVSMVRNYYAAHKHEHMTAFAGVSAMLDGLVERELTLAVLSNKPHEAAGEVVQQLFSRWSWAAVVGARPDVPLKPDPQAALALADALSISPQRWLYVGDTKVDMLTGRSAGMYTVGVTWGFRDEAELREHGADAIIHQPTDLLAILTSLERSAISRSTSTQ